MQFTDALIRVYSLIQMLTIKVALKWKCTQTVSDVVQRL